MQLNGHTLRIIAAQCYICAVLIFSCLLYWFLALPSESLIYPACLFLVALAVWSFWSWKILTKSLFDPYILFFIAALLFNGGQAFLEVFHLNEDGILEGMFSSENILKTLFIVLLGLATFHLGALLSTATGKAISPKQSIEKQVSLLSMENNCRIVGWGLLAISFLPTILVAKDALSTVTESGYAALYQQEQPISFNKTPVLLSNFIIPATLFLLAGSKSKHNIKVLCVFTVLIYSATQFFLGERNSGVMPLIAFTWLWHSLFRPIPKIFVFSIAALLILIVFPLIGSTRNMTGQDRVSIDFLLSTFSSIDNPLIASISEMGGSMKTVAYTLELVPNVRGFEMGVGYFYALLTLVPNLFWKVHPAAAHGLPSDWLIWEVDPYIASLGGSFGFSFIAEAYLNFGWWGAPIILGVSGFLLGKFTLWAVRSGEPARIALLASFISFFLFYARAQATDIVRPLVWYSFIPYLVVCALSSFRSK
jgi:oligosaccharide repeat unit polymerase